MKPYEAFVARYSLKRLGYEPDIAELAVRATRCRYLSTAAVLEGNICRHVAIILDTSAAKPDREDAKSKLDRDIAAASQQVGFDSGMVHPTLIAKARALSSAG